MVALLPWSTRNRRRYKLFGIEAVTEVAWSDDRTSGFKDLLSWNYTVPGSCSKVKQNQGVEIGAKIVPYSFATQDNHPISNCLTFLKIHFHIAIPYISKILLTLKICC